MWPVWRELLADTVDLIQDMSVANYKSSSGKYMMNEIIVFFITGGDPMVNICS